MSDSAHEKNDRLWKRFGVIATVANTLVRLVTLIIHV